MGRRRSPSWARGGNARTSSCLERSRGCCIRPRAVRAHPPRIRIGGLTTNPATRSRPVCALAPGAAARGPALALLAGACGGGSSATGNASPPTKLTVFGAASLTDAFTKLGTDFTAAHPGVNVTFNFAGSQDLVAQLQQGAPADVLATADTATMDKVAEPGRTRPRCSPATSSRSPWPPGIRSTSPASPTLRTRSQGRPRGARGAGGQVRASRSSSEPDVDVKPVSLEESVKGVVTKVVAGRGRRRYRLRHGRVRRQGQGRQAW